MKNFAKAALVVVLSFVPIGAFADTPPAPPPDGPPGPMEQVHAQMEQAQSQARTAALNALTPANRALLGQVVGQLATASVPDVGAAAKTLDAALSPKEAKAILDAQTALETHMRQVMEQVRGQMGGPPGPGRMMGPPPGSGAQAPDAGAALLRLAVPHLDPPRFIRVGGPGGG